MDNWEKIAAICLILVVGFFLALFSCIAFSEHTFEGYYLKYGAIHNSFRWIPDDKAFDYTPEMWQKIIDNDLHLKPQNKGN